MYNEEVIGAQQLRSKQALDLMRDLLPLTRPIALHPEWSIEERSTLAMLLTSAARSTESVLLLSTYGQLWDAEMTLRAVTEASLKFSYILQSRENFKQRIKEFSVDHFNVSLLKDDSKIRSTLSSLSDPASAKWRPLRDRLLSADKLDELILMYDKTFRRSIESRWGLGGILNSLRQDQKSGAPNFDSLLHNYSLASHIQHADYIGVSIPEERDGRDPKRRDAVHLAHLSRLISDSFALFIVRLTAAYKFIGNDLAPLHQAQRRADALQEAFGDPYEEWLAAEYETQPRSV